MSPRRKRTAAPRKNPPSPVGTDAGPSAIALPIRPPYLPMAGLLVSDIPRGSEWQYEPKWDGFRCLGFRDGDAVELQSKSVIAKRSDVEYRSGDRTGMQKIKLLRTADCVVGGFRYASKGKALGSLLLGLYDRAGKLDHVGFCSGLTTELKKELLRELEKRVKPPGFTGQAPGGPNRWSTERTGEWEPLDGRLVVEVQYDHFTGGRFRHGTRLLRFRPDKGPKQCTREQVEQESRVSPMALLEGRA